MKSGDQKIFTQNDFDSQHSIKITPIKKPKIEKNDNFSKNFLDGNFIPPDGGWGWMVVIAAAISMFVTCDVVQQFELLLNQRTQSWSVEIQYSHAKKKINIQSAASIFTCLFLGEIYRRFTFRQICFAGAVLTFSGLALSVFFDPEMAHMFSIPVMYGIGRSLIWTSSLIVVYTYFHEKRLSAIACMVSISSLGVILFSFLHSFLLGEYNTSWIMFLYAGLTLHNFVSAFVYQPVEWHLPEPEDIEMDQIRPLNLMFGSLQIRKLNALEVPTDSNDDLSSQLSFPSHKGYPLKVPKNSCASFAPLQKPIIPKIILPDETEYFESIQEYENQTPAPTRLPKRMTILQKIWNFFDLDILLERSYLNLALGLTVIHFVETHFASLLPLILNEFEYDENQIVIAVIVHKICDLVMKILAPFVGPCLSCSNKAILMFALLGTCIGRAVLVFGNNFVLVIMCFGLLGVCRALSTIYWFLVLPCVPLERVPAAIGWQQVMSGFLALVSAPLIGMILNTSRYSFTLNCMNAVCFIISFLWLGENLFKLNSKMRLQRGK